MLLAIAALAFGLAACGGDEEEAASTATAPAQVGGAQPGDGSAAAKDDAKGGVDQGQDPTPTGQTRLDGGRNRPVDLSTDPGSIRGARVTETGVVQTLPPSEAAHRTAQKNTYGSIRAFGSEVEGEEATEITFALVQFLTAKANADWATACSRLYTPLRERFEQIAKGRGCAEAFGALMGQASRAGRAEQARIDVSSIRRGEGNRAFVIYKTPDTLSADMPMYVEDGVWKVAAIEAYVLRPEQVG